MKNEIKDENRSTKMIALVLMIYSILTLFSVFGKFNSMYLFYWHLFIFIPIFYNAKNDETDANEILKSILMNVVLCFLFNYINESSIVKVLIGLYGIFILLISLTIAFESGEEKENDKSFDKEDIAITQRLTFKDLLTVTTYESDEYTILHLSQVDSKEYDLEKMKLYKEAHDLALEYIEEELSKTPKARFLWA